MLEDWLSSVTNTDKTEIDLGLTRCRQVAKKMDLVNWDIPVVVVGGTNGKGSTLAVLDSIYAAAGYKRLLYTSPHILKFNERIRKNGLPVSDSEFMQAIKVIDAVRGDVHLTFFEWVTLAALQMAKTTDIDVLLLEVGLGGRLDAVNVVESDLAVITSIALDHTDYLGDTREAIAFEKAGILRRSKPAVCGEPHIPDAIIEKAQALSAPLSCYGKDYQLTANDSGWVWGNASGCRLTGSSPVLLNEKNVATGLQAAYLLRDKLPVSAELMQMAVEGLTLAGRVERRQFNDREWVFDVAHNPQAAQNLSKNLPKIAGRTWGLFSALASKDIYSMVRCMQPVIDGWLVPQLRDFRAMPLSELKVNFAAADIDEVSYFAAVDDAVSEFLRVSAPGDRCVVFGSFVTVGCVQANREIG